jgi:hypothetical protein
MAPVLLDERKVADALRSFREDVPRVFGDELVFGFVSGGFAKGYATSEHDIDAFVCVRELRVEASSAFRAWYLDAHRALGVAPDLRDPGEIVPFARLTEKIEWVRTRHLAREVQTYYEYEAVVWADMLSGAKAARIGDIARLAEMEAACELLPQRWRADILSRAEPSRLGELWTLPLALLCEKEVRYAKRGDNTMPE